MTLAEHIKKSHPLVDNKGLFQDILYGVHLIHSQGFAHSDLKPTNILISETGHPKIADFGLATRKKSYAGFGTFAYAAPEVFDRTKESMTDYKLADVWSLGMIYYFMITGRPPYTIAELMAS